MTICYRWNFEFEPVANVAEAVEIIKRLDYDIDSYDLLGSEAPYALVCWGEGSISAGGGSTEKRHEEIKKQFSDKKVKSYWRCTEMDQWDDIFEVDNTQAIACPKCKANQEHIRYVQDVTQYHHIDAIYEDGSIDLGSIQNCVPHDDYELQCEVCEETFSLEEEDA